MSPGGRAQSSYWLTCTLHLEAGDGHEPFGSSSLSRCRTRSLVLSSDVRSSDGTKGLYLQRRRESDMGYLMRDWGPNVRCRCVETGVTVDRGLSREEPP